LQRVGFAPLPNAPEVHVSAPDIFSPGESDFAQGDIDVADDASRDALAALYAVQEIETPRLEPRDGPISSINPSRAGIFAGPDAAELALASKDSIPDPQKTDIATQVATIDPGLAAAAKQAAADAVNSVDIYATADAWVRVRDGGQAVLFTGILGPGERFTLPRTASQPELRAGNAGAVYVVLGGAVYGPLGDGPAVAKNVRLSPDVIRATYPVAVGIDAGLPRRAEAEAAENAEVAVEARLATEGNDAVNQ
jgi:hypothetical protein